MVQEILFEDISSLELCQRFSLAQWNNLCNICSGHYDEHFCEIVFRPVVQEMLFKDIAYDNLELWWPVCLAKRNQLCSFGRRHHEEHFCEIILNLDQWFRRCHLKTFLV